MGGGVCDLVGVQLRKNRERSPGPCGTHPSDLELRVAAFSPRSRSCFETSSTSARRGRGLSLKPLPKYLASAVRSARNHASMHWTIK